MQHKTTLNNIVKHLKEQLHQCLKCILVCIQQTVVDKVTNEWISCCIHAKLCHFEHLP